MEREVDPIGERAGGGYTGVGEVRRRTLRFVVVIETGKAIVVDRRRPASGLDDEEDRVFFDRDPIAASPIRQNDVAPVRNGDAPNAEVERVARSVAIAIVENHTRGEIAACLDIVHGASRAGHDERSGAQ